MISIKTIRLAIRAKYHMPHLTIRQQGAFAGASHQSMMRINHRCEEANVSQPLAETLSDSELMQKLYPSINKHKSNKRQPSMTEIIQERTKARGKRKSITVLFLEYLTVNPSTAMSRTHFFRLVNKALKRCKLSMRQLHAAGEVVFVDYAGTQVFFMNTGRKVWLKVFVAVLGASKKIFAWATYAEKTEHWIDGMARMFEYFGGSAAVVSMDNAKALVTKPGLVPNLVANVNAFGEHYGCIMDTCRVGRPQDKSLVEVAVKFVTQRVLIPANQNQTFFSIDEVNSHIMKSVEALNAANFQGLDISRNDLFDANEKAVLKPLPASPYKMIVNRMKQKVPPNYHIKYLRHEYSVPHEFRGKTVDIFVDQTHINIFHEHKKVAQHALNPQPFSASTVASHIPIEHQADMNNNDMQTNLDWASTVGSAVKEMVASWYTNISNPQSRAIGKRCLALKKLHEKFGKDVLVEACEYASLHGMTSPSDINLIISAKNHEDGFKNLPSFKIAHQNVRGAQYFGGHHEA
jgi:transposase